MRAALIIATLFHAAGCEPGPENIDVLVHVKPDSLAGAVSLNVRATLNGKPALQPFEFSDKPLDHFWVRMPIADGGGQLHLDIAAKDTASCIVWQGSVDAITGPPYLLDVTAMLSSLNPPRC